MRLATINEIAVALGVHETSVRRRASKMGWEFEEQIVRGGKAKLFIINKLPKAVQVALATHQSIGTLLANGSIKGFVQSGLKNCKTILFVPWQSWKSLS